jgi:hypothetical protein
MRGASVKRAIVFPVAMALVVGVLTVASPQEEPIGRVDWVNGYVSGFGIGTADARANRGLARTSALRAARVDALRNLLEMIHGMHIDPSIQVQVHMTSDGAISRRIKGLVDGARLVDSKTHWMGGSPMVIAEMRVCISAYGKGCSNNSSLVSALDLEKYRDRPGMPGVNANAFGPSSSGSHSRVASENPVTGVVFSLGGLSHRRVVLPVVAAETEEGIKTVYSAQSVGSATVRTRGVAGYTETLQQVKDIDRVGDNYMIVPVEAVAADNTLMISLVSARKIHESTGANNNYLHKAQVVISQE